MIWFTISALFLIFMLTVGAMIDNITSAWKETERMKHRSRIIMFELQSGEYLDDPRARDING